MTSVRTVLAVQGVSKHYPNYRSILHRMGNWFGLPDAQANPFKAIDNLTLELKEGEALGLIGQNGAGKSTLLKIITGTVQPNSGQVFVNGNISAILELGLGFNPEFTGRENVIHSGALLGHSPTLLRKLMPEIEAFAEIGEYFDRQVRTYSSGMQARLAFALATAVVPEVLIVDEALSVGDAYFQHKSFAKIREFKECGCSIILVSHALGDIRELCDRVALMDAGKITKEGSPDEVIDYYNAIIAQQESQKLKIKQERRQDGWLKTEVGDGRAKVNSISLHKAGEKAPASVVFVGETVEVRSEIEIREDLDQLVIGHRITDRTGHIVWGTNTWHTGDIKRDLKKGDKLTTTMTFECALGPGSYALNFGLHRSETHLEGCYHKVENQIVFEVLNSHHPFFVGSSHLKGRIMIEEMA